MQKDRNLILIGDSAFAEVAYEYFTHDSPYEVVGFSVERAFMKRDRLFGLPVVAFEELEQHFEPASHSYFAALVYTNLNRLRARLHLQTREKGYVPASFISSRAMVWPNARIGEHCFILENNVVQPFVTIGDNVILWSGNHVGHHSTIRDHCFVSSHVVISGFVDMGTHCFVGVNATVGNNVTIGSDCLIGAGAVITKDLGADSIVKANAIELSKVSAKVYFKVKDAA